MTTLLNLPTELLEPILTDSFEQQLQPLTLLLLNRRLTSILLNYIYTKPPTITSVNQLKSFIVNVPSEKALQIKSLEIVLPSATGSVWNLVGEALIKCKNVKSLKLKVMGLWDEDRTGLINGLNAIDPEYFEWTSPDPPHHISLSLVTPCLTTLLSHLPKWTKLKTLSLSNLQFPLCDDPDRYLPPILSTSVQSIKLSQAIRATPKMLAGVATACPRLKSFHLEDVYTESIWGSRVNEKDIKFQLDNMNSFLGTLTLSTKLQRIVGGDRGDLHNPIAIF